ncbi:zinc ribbon domain-containing protein [Vagococcus sp. PNs007]|uniref:Zinc ribbon domain-containing protein n=1 Tax=Vagococcus proximus TaxID=2991417 RepID=A0ABT5X0Y2_9ENTE|nr:zinc ribbon domain-containing protein [Vagococcus proximus]MDF0479577.1 zinc ribbon domain-containing protein [Vagococcus proximus]
MFCSKCGNECSEGACFCPGCGNKLEEINNEKLLSEEFIKKSLLESKEANISVAPDIEEKKLLSMTKITSDNIDPTKVIGIVDTSAFSNGKAGLLFTGDTAYMKESFGTADCIPYVGINNVEYDLNQEYLDNGKVKEKKKLVIQYEDEENVREIYTDVSYPLNLLGEILKGIKDNVETIDSKDQVVQLQNLDPMIIELYFRVIICYLKLNDGVIDQNEYKELISLMVRLKLSKELSANLRTYRFSEDNEDVDELLRELNHQLDVHKISSNAIYQSLGMDIIGMNLASLDEWKEDKCLVYMLDKLHMTDKQVEFTIRKINIEKQIIESRMDDSQIKGIVTELSALAAGAGISLGALAITGAVSGFGGITGGLLAVSLGSGGTLIGAAAVAASAYGVYKGIKHIAGTSELEKFGIRMATLTKKIEILRDSNVHIIEDINWINQEMGELANTLFDAETLNEELVLELRHMILKVQKVSGSGRLIEEEQTRTEKEYIITKLPEVLDEEKFNELNKNKVQRVEYSKIINKAYKMNQESMTNENESEGPEVQAKLYLDESQNSDSLELVLNILEDIGYFNTATSSMAQGKVVAKKGMETLKKGLFGK